MKTKVYRGAFIVLFAAIGVVGGSAGITNKAEASGWGHHSNQSLAGRNFQIHGTWVEWNDDPAGRPEDFSNCYRFRESRVWEDPKFPNPDNPSNAEDGFIPGTWIQHTGGFVIRYTAFATGVDLFGPGVDLDLIQNGTVTPTFRRGKLRLNAYSTVVIANGFVLGVVRSTGYSVDSCE
ncbi:MAG: hypothetical protein QNJ07_04605 [Woeseiaceae bacterium]|nr:hypothetical protein [Woeseiaceae bacterium]